jgi:hypothetical protein
MCLTHALTRPVNAREASQLGTVPYQPVTVPPPHDMFLASALLPEGPITSLRQPDTFGYLAGWPETRSGLLWLDAEISLHEQIHPVQLAPKSHRSMI